MAKYGYEVKKQVVEAYLRGEGGYTYLAEKYGITNTPFPLQETQGLVSGVPSSLYLMLPS